MSQLTDSAYLKKTVPQLVTALKDHAQPGSPLHAEITGALAANLVGELVSVIDRHAAASNSLANKVFWLNVAIGALTLVGTIAGVVSVLG